MSASAEHRDYYAEDVRRRTCRYCGGRFTVERGAARGRGCRECEPRLEDQPAQLAGGNGSSQVKR